MEEKLQRLKEDIGEGLYNRLTPKQRKLIIRTEGSLELTNKYTTEDLLRFKR